VGIIEPDGILNGSNKKDRNISTTSTIGKKERAYSTSIGSSGSSSMAGEYLKNNRYPPHVMPVTKLDATRKKEKSKSIVFVYYFNVSLLN
jgi:hypothetical protein